MKHLLMETIEGAILIGFAGFLLWLFLKHQNRYQRKKLQRYAEEVKLEHQLNMELGDRFLEDTQKMEDA